jgi:hypothetical protein
MSELEASMNKYLESGRVFMMNRNDDFMKEHDSMVTLLKQTIHDLIERNKRLDEMLDNHIKRLTELQTEIQTLKSKPKMGRPRKY